MRVYIFVLLIIFLIIFLIFKYPKIGLCLVILTIPFDSYYSSLGLVNLSIYNF